MARWNSSDDVLFQIDASTGVLSFIAAPDYETETPLSVLGGTLYLVNVRVSDGIATDAQGVVVSVTDVNEAPTALDVTPQGVTENVSGATVATFNLADPDSDASFATYTYAITGEQASKFEVSGNAIRLIAGQSLDFETNSSLALTLTATNTDNSSHVIAQNFTVAVTDVNEPPGGAGPDLVITNVGAAAVTIPEEYLLENDHRCVRLQAVRGHRCRRRGRRHGLVRRLHRDVHRRRNARWLFHLYGDRCAGAGHGDGHQCGIVHADRR